MGPFTVFTFDFVTAFHVFECKFTDVLLAFRSHHYTTVEKHLFLNVNFIDVQNKWCPIEKRERDMLKVHQLEKRK